MTIEPLADPSTPWWWWDLVAVELLAGGPRGERTRLEPDVVVGVLEAAGMAPVLLVADDVGQVLGERAAERDVDQLHPAADPEHRHVALDRAARQRDLGAVALGHGAAWSRDGVRRRTRPGRCRRRRPGSARRSDRAPRRGSSTSCGSGGIISASPPASLDRGDVAERQQRRRWSQTPHRACSRPVQMPIAGRGRSCRQRSGPTGSRSGLRRGNVSALAASIRLKNRKSPEVPLMRRLTLLRFAVHRRCVAGCGSSQQQQQPRHAARRAPTSHAAAPISGEAALTLTETEFKISPRTATVPPARSRSR